VKLTTQRNTPTLADSASQQHFFWDGRAAKLEDAILDELTSTHLGWLPHEREAALNEIHSMMIWDTGIESHASGTYTEEFNASYGADVESMDRDGAIDLAVKALAHYIRAIETPRTSPYDAFVAANGLPSELKTSETPRDFANRILQLLEAKQASGTLQVVQGFDADAVPGMTIFFGKGRCAVCHVPPLFRDNSFHNTGTTQIEYDAVHGDGSFASLAPDRDAEPRRPSTGDRSGVDWGRWRVTQLDSDLAAFRTPGLRNLSLSDPYLHNGSRATLEEVIGQKFEASRMATRGELRNSDPFLAEVELDQFEIAPLVVFLNTLNSVP
jgi:cytochrome c peroxidase